jgi:hypothetical protein
MTPSARSVFIFGVYVFVVGVAFIAAPKPLMVLLHLPAATAGWGRVVGLLALVIGSYDIVAGKSRNAAHIRASIPVRIGFAAGTALLVLFDEMPPLILLLGATDVAGAVWTSLTLRSGSGARPR